MKTRKKMAVLGLFTLLFLISSDFTSVSVSAAKQRVFLLSEVRTGTEKTTYSYNDKGLLTGIKGTSPEINNFVYDDRNRLLSYDTSYESGNQYSYTATYNADGRLMKVDCIKKNVTDKYKERRLSDTYDVYYNKKGYVCKIKRTIPYIPYSWVYSWKYNKQGYPIAHYRDGLFQEKWEYDSSGNVTSYGRTDSPLAPSSRNFVNKYDRFDNLIKRSETTGDEVEIKKFKYISKRVNKSSVGRLERQQWYLINKMLYLFCY